MNDKKLPEDFVFPSFVSPLPQRFRGELMFSLVLLLNGVLSNSVLVNLVLSN